MPSKGKRGFAKAMMRVKKQTKKMKKKPKRVTVGDNPKKDMRKKEKKVSRGHSKRTAHVDNVRGATMRRARKAAHFPIDQDDVRLRRTRHQNSLHEKARQDKSQVAMDMGKLIFVDPIKTLAKNFDPSLLTTGLGARVHRFGRQRMGAVNPMLPAVNELEVNMRTGGGSNVARGPLGKIRGLA